jgi:hypothetical protein
MSSSSLRAKLAGVDGALDALEAELQPLLAPGLAAGLAPLQQAKLAALVPYLANGLLFSVCPCPSAEVYMLLKTMMASISEDPGRRSEDTPRRAGARTSCISSPNPPSGLQTSYRSV